MKIICISGHCCSGKTTAVGTIAKHLANTGIIRGDDYLIPALINHAKEFERFGFCLDKENIGNCLLQAENDSQTTKEIYQEFWCIIASCIENEIEQEVAKFKKQSKNYVVVEYVMLPILKIWKHADYRVIITTDKEKRFMQSCIRFTKGTGLPAERMFKSHNLKEVVFGSIVENAVNVDFSITNNYDSQFDKELANFCKHIAEEQ